MRALCVFSSFHPSPRHLLTLLLSPSDLSPCPTCNLTADRTPTTNTPIVSTNAFLLPPCLLPILLCDFRSSRDFYFALLGVRHVATLRHALRRCRRLYSIFHVYFSRRPGRPFFDFPTHTMRRKRKGCAIRCEYCTYCFLSPLLVF